MKPEDLLRHPLAAQAPKIAIGCPVLDRLLGGGIPCGSITEIVAESGTGITQLSPLLLLAAQLPVSPPFISTPNFHSLSGASISYPFTDPTFLTTLWTAVDHLLDLLPRLGFLVPKLNIKLIVIDSIAALFRGEFDNTPLELKRRSSMLFKISSKLRFLARKSGLAVVVTNQVMDVMESSDDLRVGNVVSMRSSGRRVCAALGLSWANCVNTRLFMWREEEKVGEEDGSFDNMQTRRFIRVVFAPHLPDSSCEFAIRREEIFEVDR